ncbi:Exostosin and EXTL2 domain containing protein [Aphelenchoides fujianensis]|nr:Exostosin and EXTL2 domain containing protein [Aphelenchoides fujianensis]
MPFRVFVHDLTPTVNHSAIDRSFHAELQRSPYATKKLAEACLFVYVAAGAEERLAALPFWSRDGAGIVVFFVEEIRRPKRPEERRAVFVGLNDAASSIDFNLQTNVLVPVGRNFERMPAVFPFTPRRHLLSVFASTATRELQRVFSPDASKLTFVELKCAGRTDVLLGFCANDEFRQTTLNESVFTLLLPSMERFAQRFHEALLHGAIPVVVDGGLGDLPFALRIRWDKAVVHVPPHFLPEIERILRAVPIAQILEFRRNGRFFFENFLVDTKVLTRSILSAIRHELRLPAPMERPFEAKVIHATHPQGTTPRPPVKAEERILDLDEDMDYLWNENPVYLDARPLQLYRPTSHVLADMDALIPGLRTMNPAEEHFASNLSGNYPEEKFTVVMPTYQRDKQLRYTLEMLNGTRFLDAVVVLWNDLKRPIPDGLIPIIHVPIYVVNTSENSLNTRFLPFDLIRTEAILNMDDDFNTHQETIEFSFRVWRENRHAIVGPNYRTGFMKKAGVGVYNAHSTCQQNMILTSGAFLHRIYHYAYTHLMNPLIREHIGRLFNCEDIAVNFLVSHLTRRPPVKTTPIMNTGGKFAKSGLSHRGSSHYTQRSECVAMFTRIFGYNPLRVSEWRAQSMMHGHKGKCYTTT